jgi:hypothetical protein
MPSMLLTKELFSLNNKEPLKLRKKNKRLLNITLKKPERKPKLLLNSRD